MRYGDVYLPSGAQSFLAVFVSEHPGISVSPPIAATDWLYRRRGHVRTLASSLEDKMSPMLHPF